MNLGGTLMTAVKSCLAALHLRVSAFEEIYMKHQK